MTENLDQLYKKCLDKWGGNLQTIMCIEEASELVQALTKLMRGGSDLRQVAEEIADLRLMLNQIEFIYGLHVKTARFTAEKISRFKVLLE